MLHEKIEEILENFSPSSRYVEAENRYAAALKMCTKDVADQIEHAHADMAVELMAAAYARGAADARKIFRACIIHAQNDLPESELPAIVEAFLNRPLFVKSFPLGIKDEDVASATCELNDCLHENVLFTKTK